MSLGLFPLLGLYLLFSAQNIKPLLTDSISFDAKADILRSMPAEQIDVLGIGSSIALNNLGSEALQKHLGTDYTYFNAASWGLTMRELRVMLPGLLSKYTPQVLILASGPMDFEAPKIQVCSEAEFNKYIQGSNNSYFFFKNTDLFSLVQRQKRNTELTKHAKLTDRQHLLFDKWGAINLQTAQENFHHYRFDNSLIKTTEEFQFEELGKLMDLVNEHGSKLIFASTPMKKEPNCLDPACQDFIQQHHSKVQNIIESKGHIFLDLHSTHQYPDSLFCDESHLVYEGPNQLSKEIIEEVSLLDLLKNNKNPSLVGE